MWRHREKTASGEPRSEAAGETKPADTLTSDAQLHNCEKVGFCCWSLPPCGSWLELPGLTEALKEIIAKVREAFFLMQLRACQEPVRINTKASQKFQGLRQTQGLWLHLLTCTTEMRVWIGGLAPGPLKSSSYHTIGSVQWLRQCDNHKQSSSLGGKKRVLPLHSHFRPFSLCPLK